MSVTRANQLIDAMLLTENRVPALHAKWARRLNTEHDVHLPHAVSPSTSEAAAKDFEADPSAENASRDAWRSRLAFHHVVGDVDPTANKQYADRALHWYHRGQYRAEDAGRVRNALSLFHANKHRLPEKDINRYESIHALERAVQPFESAVTTPWTKSTEAQRQAVEHGSELVHDSPELSVRTVRTHDAMKVLGAHSKWCVVPDKSTWEDYDESGPMHFVHEKKTGNRYLLHLPTGQFMDEKDQSVSPTLFAAKHPDMVKLFHGQNYTMFTDKRRAEADIIAGHWDHTSPGFRYQAAEKTTNPRVLDALVDDDSYTEREHIDAPDVPVHTTVPYNPHATAETLGRMLKHGEFYLKHRNAEANWDHYNAIMSGIAKHENATPEVLQHLADHHMGSDANMYLDKNPNTPERALRGVVDHVRLELQARPNESSQDWPSQQLVHIAGHRNASPELLRHVLDSTGYIRRSTRGHVIRHTIASNKAADGDLLHDLARAAAPKKDAWHDHAVHAKIAEHPNAQPRTLRRLYDLATQNKGDDRRWVADGHLDTIDKIKRHPRFKEINDVSDAEAWS